MDDTITAEGSNDGAQIESNVGNKEELFDEVPDIEPAAEDDHLFQTRETPIMQTC